MSEKLKPCPFCGSELVSYSKGNVKAPFYFFKCCNSECGAIVSFDNIHCNFRPELAIELWNTRAEVKS
ncbi:MAG: Lar family restriction alleviation protein [Synergistaceae bacterium]|nr:Lar family restriction alleviation protein [Synergistaceae bacterium]